MRRRASATAIVAGVLFAGTLAATASAVPKENTRSTVSCLGASVTLVMHPGNAAPVLWDISTEDVANKPSYIIKEVAGEVFVDGQSQGTFSFSNGQMLGFGEPLQCEWELHEPDRDIFGTSTLVQL